MFKIGDKVKVIGNPGGAAAVPLPEEKKEEIPFKVGDWVVFHPEHIKHGFTVGFAYEVQSISQDVKCVWLKRDDGDERTCFFYRIYKWEPKVGDVVRLKKWDNAPAADRGLGDRPAFVPRMEEFVGQEAVIQFVHQNFIRVEENQWDWDKELGIEPVNAPARGLDEPVQGFNAKLRGKAMDAKKKAQKPAKDKCAQAREQLDKGATSGMTAAYCFVLTNGTINKFPNTACHAGLSYPGGDVVALYDHIRVFYEKNISNDMKPSFKKFFTFLAQRSPIAHAFITKNFEDALKNGVSLDVSKTADEVAVACCSLRFAHEHKGRIDVFDWAIKNGYNMLTAYFLMNVAWKNGDTFNMDVRNWHNIVDGEKSFDKLISGMANGWKKEGAPYSVNHGYGVSRLTHSGPGVAGPRSLSSELNALVPHKGGVVGWGAPAAHWNVEQFTQLANIIAKKLKEAKLKPAPVAE